MRWFYYAFAVVATVLAGLLWLVVFRNLQSRTVPVVAPAAIAADRLPVAPKLRPADPVHAVLFDAVRAGQAVCVNGYYARLGSSGKFVFFRVQGEPVSCP